MSEHLLGEVELRAAAFEFIAPIVDAARRVHGGPLPSMRTTEFLDAQPVVKLACLLVLAEAWLVADPHQVIRAQLREASDDVHNGDTEFWNELARRRTRDQVLAARAVPGPFANGGSAA